MPATRSGGASRVNLGGNYTNKSHGSVQDFQQKSTVVKSKTTPTVNKVRKEVKPKPPKTILIEGGAKRGALPKTKKVKA